MKKQLRALLSGCAALTVCMTAFPLPVHADYGVGGNGTAVMEYLDRGIYAVKSGNGMFVSWRWNANDADNAEFRLYRDGNLIYTSKAGSGATSYQDNGGGTGSKYRVDTVVNGAVVSSEECKFKSGTNYFDIPLNYPGGRYTPNDCCLGDVDGDGQYEIFLKWDGASADNSQSGQTDNVLIDCLTLEGKTLWRIDLGVNIRAGQHYTQMCVADFDCDGKAELITKTADGTKDGKGRVIGDGSKNYRNAGGYILSGSEFMTLFDGQTGEALDTIDFPVPRGVVSKATWGDDYGNRVDRFNSGIAYLDGVHPSAIYNRGYYTRMTISALDVVNKKLNVRWIFDTNKDYKNYAGNGNHNLMVGDVDNDGRQEISMGDCIIDDNGKGLWCSGKGHGDAQHLGDLVPERPGLELWQCHEHGPTYGVTLFDAANGSVIFHKDGDKDTGRCCADNVWAGNPGGEFWGARPANTVMNSRGEKISGKSLSMNFLIYWDGDLEREMLSGTGITKMKDANTIQQIFTANGCESNNSTKAVPCMTADLFGDWREELIMRTSDNRKLRIWCSTAPTNVRLTTLMHDMQYRAQNCCQQASYNQPPHTSYYLGSDAPLPARPKVVINGEAVNPPEPIKYTDGKYITGLTVSDTANAANWSVVTQPKQTGSEVFGDRAFKFTSVPKTLDGAEWIQTACDSKKFAGEEAAFKAGADISAFIALDTRITVPSWLGTWEKTAETLTDDGEPVVTYQLYKKDFAAGETVTLGALNQASCVNYAVAVTAQKAAPVIGDLNADGICDKADLVMMRDHLLTISALTPEQGAVADLNKDGKINAVDMTLLKQILLK